MANNVRQFKLTAEGLKQREEELEYLKSVKRKDIADKIKVALSFGDLSENSEYDEAKNEQAQVESRILELETMLKNVEIIDESELSTDVVKIGSTDPLRGSISDECPVGRAVLGKHVDELVDVEAPGGILTYQILEISASK